MIQQGVVSAAHRFPGNTEPRNYHHQEQERLVAEIAEMLKRPALANEFKSLVVVALPNTLGELRKLIHEVVSSRCAANKGRTLPASQ